MNYYVPQIKNDDCGFACLKMMIANLYQKEEALFIPAPAAAVLQKAF